MSSIDLSVKQILSEVGAQRNKIKAKAMGRRKTNVISSENSGKTQPKQAKTARNIIVSILTAVLANPHRVDLRKSNRSVDKDTGN